MSAKRKLDSDESDPEDESDSNSGHKSGSKRKPEEDSVDDNERNELKRFEEKYSKRYTEEDEEYKQCIQRPTTNPPILCNYFGKRTRNRGNDRFRGNDRYGQYGQPRPYGRGRGGHRPNYSYDNRSSNWNQRPYNRY